MRAAPPLISVPLPTITGRERWLERAVAAYETYCPRIELIVVKDRETCGIAWQEGAERATGDYIHFGADDVEMLPGWWEAAVAVIDRDLLPAPRVLNSDGSLQSCGDDDTEREDGTIVHMTRGPFVSRAQWELVGPMIPTHYYTDNWVSHRARQHGIKTVVCRGYSYIHHLAPEGRLGRELADHQTYRAMGGT